MDKISGQSLTTRALATIRKISEIKAHPNADAIELAIIDGWQCVVKKDEFVKGQLIVYFEIDSWIPTDIAPFLSKGKSPREFENVRGERLRTIKLRGELSQGLVLSRDVLMLSFISSDLEEMPLNEGTDVTELLGVKKWERPLAANLRGVCRGNFPSFIRKTDQERIQNLIGKILNIPELHNDVYEATLKIDGSSCTFYYNNGQVGVCSRNLDLKTDESNEGNAFVKMFKQLDMCAKLVALGRNIAIQGELYGVGINGNWEGLPDHRFALFDIWDIDAQSYMAAPERYEICKTLKLEHVPIIYSITGLMDNLQDFLTFANRPSILNKIAEGIVFKSLTNPNFSFKVINNEYLLQGGN